MQDYIAMVLIWLATEQQAGTGLHGEEDGITEKISAIEKMLDNQLG